MLRRNPCSLTLALTLLVGVATPIMSDSGPLDANRVRWSQLEFRASKLLITASSQVALNLEPADSVKAHWLSATQGSPMMPGAENVVRIDLGSELLGKESDLALWLDPGSGAAFQRSQLETGKKAKHNRHRSLRFTDIGVLSSTYRATEATVGQPYDQWNLTESFETYPLDLPRGTVVGEPSGLFYLLAVAELGEPGDQTQTHVFTKGQVMRVTLAAEEWTEVRVDYQQEQARSAVSEAQRIKGPQRVLRIRLDGQPLVDHDSGVDFEFLGLKGDVEVFLDTERRFPVQISGDIKRVGRGNVRLQRVVLPE